MFKFLKKPDSKKVIEPLDENDSMTEFTVDCPAIKEMASNKDITIEELEQKSDLDILKNQRVSATTMTYTENEIQIFTSGGVITLKKDNTYEYSDY